MAEIAFDRTAPSRAKTGDITLPRSIAELRSKMSVPKSVSGSESEEVPTISAIAAWDDFRLELEKTGKLESAIKTMQDYINEIRNEIDKRNLLMHSDAMKQPGSMEYNGVIRKIQKLTNPSIAKKFLKIYKRIIEQRIHELESR